MPIFVGIWKSTVLNASPEPLTMSIYSPERGRMRKLSSPASAEILSAETPAQFITYFPEKTRSSVYVSSKPSSVLLISMAGVFRNSSAPLRIAFSIIAMHIS